MPAVSTLGVASAAAAASMRLYQEAKASEVRLAARRAELIALRETSLMEHNKAVPTVSTASKVIAENARARRRGDAAANAAIAEFNGALSTSSLSSLPSDAQAQTPWDRLFAEARLFASMRSRAIAVAAASASPTYTPAIGAESESLVLARRAADALQALKPEARSPKGFLTTTSDSDTFVPRGASVWDSLFEAATSAAGLSEMARECDRCLESAHAGGGSAANAAAGLGGEAAKQFAAFVQELGEGKGGKAAAAAIPAPPRTAPPIWAQLAVERKDTELLEAIKMQLELAACSFVPNRATRAEQVAAARPGVFALRSGTTVNSDTRPSAVWESVLADVSKQLT